MATYYVDVAAVGANNGSSWGDAWVSIHSALAAVAGAGDTVLVDDGHGEDLGTSRNYTIVGASPLRVLSVDKADDSLSPGAQVRNNGGTRNTYFYGNWYMHGMRWESGGQIGFAPAGSEQATCEQCYFKVGIIGGTGYFYPNFSLDDALTKFIDVDVELVRATSVIIWAAPHRWIGGSLITSSAAGHVFLANYDGIDLRVSGVDLSAESGALFWPGINTTHKGEILLEGCKLNAAVDVMSGPIVGPSSRFKVHHCQAGLSIHPTYAMEEHAYYGTIKVSIARYRTDGASDKVRTVPYSWEMEANALAEEIYLPLASPPLAGWTAGDGSTEYTYTIYLASDATMQDDEFWAELSVPNDDDTSSQVKVLSSRLDPQGTPANITSDADSTWNGAGVGTLQKLVFTHIPDKPGPIEARLFLAKASDTVYVDPKIYITRGGKPDMAAQGRATVVPGYGAVQEGDARMLVSGMGGGLR